MSKLFDQDTLENKKIYTKKELKEGLQTSNDENAVRQMINDRDILAPLDIFRRYSSAPKLYEDVLSEHDIDDIIDWILKSYITRRPNRVCETSHWSEKDMVFFLNHDYKHLIKTYWHILKDIIPLYDPEHDVVGGNFYLSVRGYDCHNDFFYYEDYKRALKNKNNIKYFIPYKMFVIPLFTMSKYDPPYNLTFTAMKERHRGFGQTYGDSLFHKLLEYGEPASNTSPKCLFCKTKDNLIHAQDNFYYNLCVNCVHTSLDKCWSDQEIATQTNLWGNKYTGRYRKFITRDNSYFYDENGPVKQESLNTFHFDLPTERTTNSKWEHVPFGTFVGFREEVELPWRAGHIICEDANTVHVSSNLGKVGNKAGLMVNIAKPIYG